MFQLLRAFFPVENQLVFNRAQMCYTDTILKKKQGDLPMAIKCVALDLDGTTLDRQGKLSPANRQAIEAAIAQGVHVVIASGRSYDTLPKKVLSIPGIQWAITCNGAAVYRVPEGEVRCRHTMTPASVETIFQVRRGSGPPLRRSSRGWPTRTGGCWRTRSSTAVPPWGQVRPATRKPVPDIVQFIRDHNRELDSIDLVLHTQEDRDRLWKALAQRSDELYITSSVYHLLELSSHKGGKANGLRWVLDSDRRGAGGDRGLWQRGQ